MPRLKSSVSKAHRPIRHQRHESSFSQTNPLPLSSSHRRYAHSRHFRLNLLIFAQRSLFARRKFGQFSVRQSGSADADCLRPSARHDFRKFPRAGPMKRAQFAILLRPSVTTARTSSGFIRVSSGRFAERNIPRGRSLSPSARQSACPFILALGTSGSSAGNHCDTTSSCRRISQP